MAQDYGAWYAANGYRWGAGAGAQPIYPFECATLGNRASVFPRPIPYWQHTEEAQWVQDVGTWHEEPSFQGLAWNVLHCIDSSGTLTSDFTAPAYPNFLVGFYSPGVALGWDPLEDPPYISIGWGPETPTGAQCGYEFRVWYDGCAEIFEWSEGGAYASLGTAQLSWRWTSESPQWLWLMICHLSNGIAVKDSGSGSWETAPWWWVEGEADIAPPSGTIRFSHAGGQAYFSLCSLLGPASAAAEGSEYAGVTSHVLTSTVMTTDRTRAAGPTVDVRSLIPTPVSYDVEPDLAVVALNHDGTDEVELEATLTWGYKQILAGQADAAQAYTFAWFPEFYAAQARHDPTLQAPNGGLPPYEIWSAQMDRVVVTLPDDAEMCHAELNAVWLLNDQGGFLDWLAGACLDLALGWVYDDDSQALTSMISGYADALQVVEESPNRLRISGNIVDCTVRLRACEADSAWPVMDGWAADDAVQYVLDKFGWHSSRASLTALATYTLSEGRPEEPLWRAGPGQSAWDFIERIARYCGCEFTVTVGGGLLARTMMYFDTGTTTTWPSTSCLTPPGVQTSRRNIWSFTGVEVRGRTEDGEELVAIRADANMESNPAYAFYKGYRRLEQFYEPGLTTQADVDTLADILYNCMRYRIGDEVRWRIPDDLARVRRQCAYITGLFSGVDDIDRLGITALVHSFGPRLPDCCTDIVAVPYPS